MTTTTATVGIVRRLGLDQSKLIPVVRNIVFLPTSIYFFHRRLGAMSKIVDGLVHGSFNAGSHNGEQLIAGMSSTYRRGIEKIGTRSDQRGFIQTKPRSAVNPDLIDLSTIQPAADIEFSLIHNFVIVNFHRVMTH